MSETIVPAAEGGVTPNAQGFDPRAAMKSVALSLFVNGVLPFILYKILVPYFPNGSVMPLLYASAFPLIGLTIGLIRTRSVDAIAILALFGIVYSVGTTLLAGAMHSQVADPVRLAMILGATQAFVIAAAFVISTVIRKPVIFFIVRQFAVGNDPARRVRFNAVNEADRGRTCTIATLVWAVGIVFLGVVGIALAFTLPPATYLLVNNIVNTVVQVLLVIWTITFVRPRLERVGEKLAAA